MFKRMAKGLFLAALAMTLSVQIAFADMSAYVTSVETDATGRVKTTYDLSLIPAATILPNSNNEDNNQQLQGISKLNMGISPMNATTVSNWDVSINFLYGNAYYENYLNFGQTLTVEAYARNSTAASKAITLYAATYDNNGRLLQIFRTQGTITNNGLYQAISVNVPLPATNTTGYKVKAFVWDETSLQPYVNNITLTGTANNDYHANIVGTANFVNYAKPINGRIDTTSDIDFIKFSPTTTGDYIIAIQSAQALTGVLYDTNQTTIINQSTIPTAQGVTYLKGTLTANQVYYMRMSGSTVADYSISINKPTDGGTLTLNTAKTGTITSGNNFYRYSFTAPTAGTYTFTSVGTTEIKGILYNTSTTAPTIAYTRDGTVSFSITKTLAANETCYLVVTPKTSGVTGAYTLYVEVPMDIVSVQ